MKTRRCFLTWFVVFFVLSSYGHCLAENQAKTLTVKEIVLKTQKSGEEKVTVLCSQACVPALSELKGNKPRIIMDFAGVSYIEPKYRNVPVSGKYVKEIRSYLDRASKKLRVVLDMDPSKHYVVHPTQDQTANAYSIVISDIDQERRPINKDLKPAETEVKRAPVSVDSTTEDKISVERGRTQMNVGNYAGAINTFTELIAKNPKESLPYRLRGNAYQNMGDRQKAAVDWITAARLGDEIVQSYLDYMQINWKEAPKP
jgi:tetratricopeptide (TPR) repeat protein